MWGCVQTELVRQCLKARVEASEDVALNDVLTIDLDQCRCRLRGMTALHKTVERIAARVLGIPRMIAIRGVWAREVAMAKVIDFYIPKNFRRSFNWVPEPQRGKIIEFCARTKKSA